MEFTFLILTFSHSIVSSYCEETRSGNDTCMKIRYDKEALVEFLSILLKIALKELYSLANYT